MAMDWSVALGLALGIPASAWVARTLISTAIKDAADRALEGVKASHAHDLATNRALFDDFLDQRRTTAMREIEQEKALRGHELASRQQSEAFVREELAKSYVDRCEMLHRYLEVWQGVYRAEDVGADAMNRRVVDRSLLSLKVMLAFRDDTIAADVGASLVDAEYLAKGFAQPAVALPFSPGQLYGSFDRCTARMIDSINALGVSLGLPPFALTEKRAALIESIKSERKKG